MLGDPATCPHGNPIPGSKRQRRVDPTVPLAGIVTGTVTVSRISEKLELDDDGLRFVATARLMPGCTATVSSRNESGVLVSTATGDYTVPTRVAEQLHVTKT